MGPAHRARLVHDYISKKKDWRSEFLPPYAPELNPVENVWCYLKTNSMANEALYELDNLTKSARRHGRALQKREPLLRSLLKHTPLFLRLKKDITYAGINNSILIKLIPSKYKYKKYKLTRFGNYFIIFYVLRQPFLFPQVATLGHQ